MKKKTRVKLSMADMIHSDPVKKKPVFFSFRPYLMKNSCSFTTHNTCCIHTRCKKHLFFFMPDIFHSVPVKKRLVSLILPTKKSASYGHAKLYEYVICTALCLAQCNDKGQETADKAAMCSFSIVPPPKKRLYVRRERVPMESTMEALCSHESPMEVPRWKHHRSTMEVPVEAA